jgi:hypothetical protein
VDKRSSPWGPRAFGVVDLGAGNNPNEKAHYLRPLFIGQAGV